MNFVYGIGASVVIIGAWGKIMHFGWANLAITVGLLTEAVIFAISALEPPHEDVDWSLVYPELAGMPGEGGHGKGKIGGGDSVTQELDKLLSDAKIGPELIESLGDGMRKLSDSTSKLSTIGDAAEANTAFVTNIKAAASNVNKLSESYVNAANSLTGISMEDGQNYGEQLSRVSKNLSALNSVYELQIQGSKEYVESSAKAYSSINEMLQYLSQSVDDTKRYKEEIHVLGQNLAALNTVYGNMLSAMNFRPNA
jgi:gliding motility-associated protein GldL